MNKRFFLMLLAFSSMVYNPLVAQNNTLRIPDTLSLAQPLISLLKIPLNK